MSRRLLILGLLASLVLTACGGSSGESQSLDTGTGTTPEKGGSLGAQDIAPTPSGDGSAMIVTGSLALVVEDLDRSIAAARALVEELGGTLVSASRGSDGGYPYPMVDGASVLENSPAMLSFRIPATALEQATDRLKELGELISERRDASDVSSSLRDLTARLKNLRAAEANYLRLLDRAASVSDILAVQAQLDPVRGEIERLVAEQQDLTGQVERSLLTLTLYPPSAPIASAADGFDPLAIGADALGALVGIARALVTGLIWFAVFLIPLLLLGGLLRWLVRRR